MFGWKVIDESLMIRLRISPSSQTAQHMQSWKNIPSPVSYFLTGMKFDPNPSTAPSAHT